MTERSELMDTYGIQFNGRYYAYGKFHYDTLEESLQHARQDAHQMRQGR